jgi:hypothetical protein
MKLNFHKSTRLLISLAVLLTIFTAVYGLATGVTGVYELDIMNDPVANDAYVKANTAYWFNFSIRSTHLENISFVNITFATGTDENFTLGANWTNVTAVTSNDSTTFYYSNTTEADNLVNADVAHGWFGLQLTPKDITTEDTYMLTLIVGNNTSIAGPVVTNSTEFTVVVDGKSPSQETYSTNQTGSYLNSATGVLLSSIVNDTYLNLSRVNLTVLNVSNSNAVVNTSAATCTYVESGNGYFCNLTYTATVDGNYTFNVTSYDNASNTNITSAPAANWFVFDGTNPAVDYTTGGGTSGNTSYLAQSWVYINVTVNDTNYNYTTFNVYNSSGDLVNSSNSSTGGIDLMEEQNFTLTDTDEVLSFNVTSYDRAGNSLSSGTYSLTLDNTNPTHETYATNQTGNYLASATTVLLSAVVNDTYLNVSRVNITVLNVSDSNSAVNSSLATCTLLAGIGYSCNSTYVASVDGNYTFNVTSYDNASNTNITSAPAANWFVFDGTNPAVDYTTGGGTSGNTSYLAQSWVYINVTVNDTNYNYTTFNVYNSSGDLVNSSNSSTGGIDLMEEQNFTLTDTDEVLSFNVTSYDRAGNSLTSGTYIVTLDNTNPTHGTYADNDSDNFHNGAINFTFNVTDTNLNTSRVNATVVYVDNTSNNVTGVEGAVCTSGASPYACYYIWTPASTVSDGNYTINITSYDNASNTLTSTSTVWNVYDNTNVTALNTTLSPADGAINVVTTAVIAVTFNETLMDGSTLNTSTFFVKYNGGANEVIGTVATSDNITYTFTPSSTLTGGIPYTVTLLAPNVTDKAGNPLTTNYSWSFTTAAPGSAYTPPGGSVGGVGGVPPRQIELAIGDPTAVTMENGEAFSTSICGDSHLVRLKSLVGSQATIRITSDPIELTLQLGDTARIDLDGDLYTDLKVKFVSMKQSTANFKFETVERAPPVQTTTPVQVDTASSKDMGTEPVVEAEPVQTAEVVEEETVSEGMKIQPLWIAIGAAAVILLIGTGVFFSKKQE